MLLYWVSMSRMCMTNVSTVNGPVTRKLLVFGCIAAVAICCGACEQCEWRVYYVNLVYK